MYRLKTASERVALATHLAMKGMSVADISEVTGHSPETIRRWLERAGAHSEKLHEHLFKGLVVVHVQVDELVTRVRRWAKRVWVWTAQDAQSKAWLACGRTFWPHKVWHSRVSTGSLRKNARSLLPSARLPTLDHSSLYLTPCGGAPKLA
jgi:hypothetical protein